jgi:hypothetical protein
MSEETESEELRMHIPGLRQKGDVLRVHQLSFVEQTASRLLFPAGGREDLRPQLQGVCQGVEIVEKQKAGRWVARPLWVSRGISNQKLRMSSGQSLLRICFRLPFVSRMTISFRR